MVTELQIDKLTRAKIWINELPESHYEPEQSLNIDLASDVSTGSKEILAGVEFFAPTGPKASYGLLGGKLIISEMNSLRIKVGVLEKSRSIYCQSICQFQSDKTYICLPSEYAKNVVKKSEEVFLEQSANNSAMVSGDLFINCAASNTYHSSIKVFDKLAEILCTILCDLNKNKLKEFEEYFAEK